MPKHVLSHRLIYARFYEIEVERFSPAMQRFLQVPEEELEQYAVSRLIALYREKWLRRNGFVRPGQEYGKSL